MEGTALAGEEGAPHSESVFSRMQQQLGAHAGFSTSSWAGRVEGGLLRAQGQGGGRESQHPGQGLLWERDIKLMSTVHTQWSTL